MRCPLYFSFWTSRSPLPQSAEKLSLCLICLLRLVTFHTVVRWSLCLQSSFVSLSLTCLAKTVITVLNPCDPVESFFFNRN